MKKNLIICNTPYQIFVALWLKMKLLNNDITDIIISDHMQNNNELSKNVESCNLFRNTFRVESLNLCRSLTSRTLRQIICPDRELSEYVPGISKYDEIYMANVDHFTELVYHTYMNGVCNRLKNKDTKIYIFEDGMSTYSKLFEKYYKDSGCRERRCLFFYKPKKIYGNLSGIYLFDPDAILWKPDTKVLQIPKIDADDKNFVNTVNKVFSYEKMTDVYDRKYIFMEESFYAEGEKINDVEILNQIADIVGKENIMVKIHPRNPVNRFKEIGYKTNENISIPWEVIILNQNMDNKILLTIASTAVLNPLRVFNKNVTVYSLYRYLDNVPKILSGDLWDATLFAFNKYKPLITICNEDINSVFKKGCK